MRRFLLLLTLVVSGTLTAQTTSGLLAFYPFDGDLTDVTGNSANTGIAVNPPSYLCGVDDTAISFNGANDQVNLAGPLVEEFNVEDFSVSFYFKSTGNSGIQYLLSKRRTDCASDFAFFIRYRPSTRTINAVLTETPNKNISLTHQLDADKCWQHIAVVRDDTRIKLYVNGQLAQEDRTVGRINIENDGNLILGSSECLNTNEAPFQGLIDDLRFYNRTLRAEEVEGLYFRPDMIQTPDTLIFLGGNLNIRLSSNCGAGFSWSPTAGLNDPTAPEPVFTPIAPGATVFTVRISDDVSSCIALDSVRINVVDPNDLDCSTAFLPNAFTPNGDNLNDTYGISNPYALQKLVSFEIFDRWGGRVFFTNDPFEQWDGSFKGTPVNSGVMLYKVVFVCNDEEKVTTGSVTIMR
jgi:gliding motility-associated-like protein